MDPSASNGAQRVSPTSVMTVGTGSSNNSIAAKEGSSVFSSDTSIAACRIVISITLSQPGSLGLKVVYRHGCTQIAAVEAGTQADEAFMKPGDCIVSAGTNDNDELREFQNFLQLAISDTRPLKLDITRNVLPICLNDSGPLGFTVEEYTPPNMQSAFTKIASIMPNSQADTAGLQVGDFITYPGTSGNVDIPITMLTKTLWSMRPLVFDVLRPGMDLDGLRNEAVAVPSSRPAMAAPASTAFSAKAPIACNNTESEPQRVDNPSAAAATGSSAKIKAESSSVGTQRPPQPVQEVIELLSDSNDQEMEASAPRLLSNVSPSSSRVNPCRPPCPARTGPATHFQSGNLYFPPAIDTLFGGHESIIPDAARGIAHGWQPASNKGVTLKEISEIKRQASRICDLEYIWPMETPVPEASGGFFERLMPQSAAIVTGERPAKKARKGGRKAHSRIGRLAGTITIPVHVATNRVRNVISSKERTFFLVEDLLDAELGQRDRLCIPQGPMKTLQAIVALNDRDNPFKDRCIHAVAEVVNLGSPLPDSSIFVDVKFHVYFRRALFGLSATPAIKVVLDALQPLSSLVSQRPWVGCRQVPASTGKFTRSPRPSGQGNGASSRFDHSLPGLLWANESMGYDVSFLEKAPDYEGAKVTLRDYQQETVAWMRNQEDVSIQSGGGVPGLNGYFWERRSFADHTGDEYYYFPLGGHVLLTPPPVVSGGLLAEEMGLGKTVEVIELICSDAKSRPTSFDDTRALGGTLVVLPVSLLSQWKEEMRTKAPHLSVEVYYGDNAKTYEQFQRRGAKTTMDLADYDVVLTTMTKFQELTRARATGTMNVLDKISWHRLVVDECQFLKNDTTVIARAASAIDSHHVWMLSGTPLTNKLDDLRGELSLLRVWPFTLGTSSDAGWMDHFWAGHVKQPWDSNEENCLPVVRSLMGAVSFRHSRLQTRVADGSPLVDLPERTESFVAVREPNFSSETYINRWLEATAANLLERLDRVDARVLGQILQLRKVSSSGALLSLERVNEAQSLLAREDLRASGPGHEFRQLSLRAAALEYKRKSHHTSVVLQELILTAESPNNSSLLSPCTYCKGPRTRPVYLTCDHSLCARCCRSLVKPNGHMNCPTCRMEVAACEIIEVLMPNKSTLTPSPLPDSGSTPLDLTEEEPDQINRLLRITEESTSTPAGAKRPIDIESLEPSVRYLEGNVDFQTDTAITHTLESLRDFPDPTCSVPAFICAEYPRVPNSLTRHVIACQNRQGPSSKIKAVADEIRKILSESLEAKICVFSTFSGGLNELEDALDTVTYSIMIETSGKQKLDTDREVTELSTGRLGKVLDVPSHLYTWDSYYGVVFEGESQVTSLSRREVAIEPATVSNVPSKMVRRGDGEVKLGVNGSNDRYDVGGFVQSRRPPMPSNELFVGCAIDVENSNGEWLTGRIQKVHQTDDGGVCYDVKPDGFDLVQRPHGDEVVPKPDMLKVLPSRLEDRGDDTYRPAVIKSITSTCHDSSSSREGSNRDPYEDAIGYVRLDGSAGDAEKRGEILNVFRNDPMTSVALLTKTAAGVGLNLTNANYAIILEPSMDAHDEVQSICRVHRIGQTRPVKVLKFYVEGSIEERILKRRQQRGELTVSINALAGATSDDEEGGDGIEISQKKPKQNDASIAASKAMTLSDVKLLLGKSS